MPLTSRPLAFAAASLAALSLIGCGKADADKAFGEKVHAYLIEHPEVLVEMSNKLQQKRVAEKTKAAQSAMTKYRQALERDPRDFVANPVSYTHLTLPTTPYV